jgi:hypothetical protein
MIVPSLKLIQTLNRNSVDGREMDLIENIESDLEFFHKRDESHYDICSTKLEDISLDTISKLISAYNHSQLFEYLDDNHCLAIWLRANDIEYTIVSESEYDLVSDEFKGWTKNGS